MSVHSAFDDCIRAASALCRAICLREQMILLQFIFEYGFSGNNQTSASREFDVLQFKHQARTEQKERKIKLKLTINTLYSMLFVLFSLSRTLFLSSRCYSQKTIKFLLFFFFFLLSNYS